jgi:hypothetical protein
MVNAGIANMGVHERKDAFLAQSGCTTYEQDTQFKYAFKNFFHPYVGELIGKLNKESLPGIFNAKFHHDLKTPFFDEFYTKLNSEIEASEGTTIDLITFEDSPELEIDVSLDGPYANYNWELLFHIPLTIAVHLSKNQRFAEAQHWFHYIFDPTCNDQKTPTPQPFWKFLAFSKGADATQIDKLLALLSKSDPTDTEHEQINNTLSGYDEIMAKPFRPHVVARTRQISYQYYIIMKYLDNLIAWGDSLFLQDTVESLNEATQRYVLAANLLGPRPQRIPQQGTIKPKTFFELKKQGLDKTGNALAELEGKLPFNRSLPQVQDRGQDAAGSLFGIWQILYFCVPRNDKLLGYWDTVSDRLFKIRHCMNIQGIVRQLSLFDPPIDPGMLVKATAAGIDIASIVSGLNQPVSPVRSVFFIQKSLELCSEVRSLGSALLSAIEKGDGEHMALLRQGHEIKIQQMQQEVRFLQWKQAGESTESLLRSRAPILERYRFYLRLLGQTPDTVAAPDSFSILRQEMTEETFDVAYAALIGQYDKAVPTQAYPQLNLVGDTSPDSQSGASGQGKLYLNLNENAELNEHLPNAKRNQIISFASRQIAPIFSLLPEFPIDLHFWGIGGTIIFGGSSLTKNVQTAADIFDLMASIERHDANSAKTTAQYERRSDEWIQQSNLAARELMHIGRQIVGSLIAEQVAHHEYLNIQKQIEQSQEVDRFLHEKFTNEELYGWMQGEISRLYYEYYRFAFDTARKAEQTMKHELMRPEVDAIEYIKFNYWDGGRKGLLSGEALYLDIKKMEMTYHENNKREYELTKNISLLQVDPLALLQLRTTGRCTFAMPEELFDMDGPGHYFRRTKSVAISIPCVVGPYASVNCTLTLLKSSIRKTSVLGDAYPRSEDTEDDRFIDYLGSLQSIVTSSAQNDSGMFETNLRDERFLPFEGSGVIGEWQLELPADPSKKDPCQFDYDTISDVVIHIRYTAREAGGLLRKGATDNLKALIGDGNAEGSVRLFSVRHEFPTEWSKFQNQTPGKNQRFELALSLRSEHYPFWSQGRLNSVKRVDILADSSKSSLDVFDTVDSAAKKESLVKSQSFGNLLVGKFSNGATGIALPAKPTGDFKIFFDDKNMEDLWIAVNWTS